MKFDITLNNKSQSGAYTGKTARIYREQFNEDLIISLSKASERFYLEYFNRKQESKELSEMEFFALIVESVTPQFLERVLWVTLYSAGSITDLYTKWLDSIDDYPEALSAAAVAFQYMLGNIPIEKPKKKTTAKRTKKQQGTQDLSTLQDKQD